MRETCERCRHYDDTHGECRGQMPVLIVVEKRAGWPPVAKDDWCSKFEHRQQFYSASAKSDLAITETLKRR